MRTELETIAYIEKYILNVLTDTEIKAFETRMATDPDFKNDVELQQQLIHSLERISLQQSIQNAHKTYRFWKLLKLIGMIIIPALLVLLSLYFLNASAETTREVETIPTKVEQQVSTEKKAIIPIEKSTENPVIPKETSIEKTPVVVTPNKTTVYAENIVVNPAEEITSEVFSILIEKDTIVETKNGIVFLIPENAFVDQNQNIINGSVQLEVKEAVDSHTIMTTGLSTFFDDKPLETGGMFFIEATKDGQKLEINPQKEIIADIPTQDYKEGMQLFDGEIKNDGSINWTNPKPLDKALIPEDIFSLNFYPPNYLETLAEKGYDVTNKKFTDSLYYSFGDVSKKAENYQTIGEYIEKEFNRDKIRSRDTLKTDVVKAAKDSLGIKLTLQNSIKGLNPLKVKTIWNERYQNTFIATKAFEERLRVIHQHCEFANSIFDLYAKNLNRDLHEVDKMIATRYEQPSLREQFEFFAAQNLTNISNPTASVSKLNDYYLKQQKVYRLALEETQRKMDSLLEVDKKYQTFSKQQLQNYYSDELALTTDKVAKRLTVRLPRRFNRTRNRQRQSKQTNVRTNTVSSEISRNVTSTATIIKKEKRKRVYRAPIRRTGWKNIDRIINEKVIASVQNRESTTIQNNKKSVTITYSNYEVSIENTERFDKLLVYLVPTKFNSFVRLKAENNRFSYKLNDLLRYRVYCIAYQNDIPFYFEKMIKNTSDKVQLRQITETVLRKKLISMHAKNNSLETEILYQTTRETNKKTLKKYREVVKLKKEIKDIVFPCIQYKTYKNIINDALETKTAEIENVNIIEENIGELPIDFVEIAPIFPGCENLETQAASKKCMSEKIQKIVNRKTNTAILSKHEKSSGTHRIFTSFIIDTSGIVTNIKIRANHPEVAAEIRRVLELIPKMKPASHRGKTVNIKYTLPIIFQVEK
ncbi:hypothetical protein [Kordia sp.]|uniref:hypothetical protein n=1 Tax=Kordia sp. TaxID=1965332 RepID=UPI003B59CD88